MYKNGALGLNENNMNKLREQEVNRNDFLETVKESSWHMKSQVDKHSFIIADSVKYSLTFHWVYRNKSVHLVVLLFLKTYVTNDLVSIFSFVITLIL